MTATSGAGPDDAPPASSLARALLGAAAGAALGVGAWAALAAALDPWSGVLAPVVGAAAGFAARKAGARGTPAAAAAAAVAMAAIFVGLGFAARGPWKRNLEARIAAVDRGRYDDFKRAAEDFDPRMPPAEIPKFAFRHEFITFADTGGVERNVERFLRETAPVLLEWKRKPPPFEEWQPRERERLRAGADPWGDYLADPLAYVSPLDLLLWLLGGAAAARLGYVPPPPRTFRKRDGRPAA